MDVIENWAKSMALVENPWDYLLNSAYAAPVGHSWNIPSGLALVSGGLALRSLWHFYFEIILGLKKSWGNRAKNVLMSPPIFSKFEHIS